MSACIGPLLHKNTRVCIYIDRVFGVQNGECPEEAVEKLFRTRPRETRGKQSLSRVGRDASLHDEMSRYIEEFGGPRRFDFAQGPESLDFARDLEPRRNGLSKGFVVASFSTASEH